VTLLFDIAAAPESEKTVVAPPARASESPVWFVNVTPVEASQPAPLSEVIVQAPETPVIVTAKAFGFVTLIFTAPVPPG